VLKRKIEITAETRAKRVLVAKDALKQALSYGYEFKARVGYIAAGREVYEALDGTGGIYGGSASAGLRVALARKGIGPGGAGDDDYEYDLRFACDAVAEACSVCMMGGLLLSKARTLNDSHWSSKKLVDADRRSVAEGLAGVFDELTLMTCECAFERTSAISIDSRDTVFLECDCESGGDVYGAACESQAFGNKAAFLSLGQGGVDRGVAIAVLLNLIANDGDFDTTQEPSIVVPPELAEELKATLNAD
jgi:hypothetical protein